MGFFAVEIYIIQNLQIQILFFPLWGPPLGGPVSDSHINLYYYVLSTGFCYLLVLPPTILLQTE